MSDNDAAVVARLLLELSQRLLLAGENPYKARAYARAAESLLTLTIPLEDVIAQNRLREIPGVGAALAEVIRALHQNGTTPRLEAMRADVPASVLEMLKIPGLAPEKVMRIHQQLEITSLDELEQACQQDRLTTSKGLGASLQAKVLQGLEFLRRAQGQRLVHHADELLRATAANLGVSHPELRHILVAGDLSRGCELVSDLALVAETPDCAGTQVVPLNEGIQLWLTNRPSFGVALLFATGSAAHVQALQTLAEGRGLRLEKGGLYQGEQLIPCASEAEVYAALGLPFVEPELREGEGEIELALSQRLPALVTDWDIQGLLHCHTDFSDGANTLAEMAEATRARGCTYFGVADHSRSAHYAGGLSIEEVFAQHALADELNACYAGQFRIFKGIESDIRADGSLDYPEDVLARFDFVVASVHSRFRLDTEAQTARIVRAVSNPYTTILGHLTGRLLLRREGYGVDIEEVLSACAQYGVAVEINANPHRLDLDWRWHRRAVELGCMLSINPDAHSADELDLTRWGVAIARKGGVPKEAVLNGLAQDDFAAFLLSRARHRTPPKWQP
jgi:DNA polymerase (family 10)